MFPVYLASKHNGGASHALLDVGGRDLVAEVDDELGELLDVDDVLWVVRLGTDDLRAARYLQWLLS